MPPETFQPSTSTKTSLLFLQKKKAGEKVSNYPIFMAVAKRCGHDRRGRSIAEDDFPIIVEKYKEFKQENDIKF